MDWLLTTVQTVGLPVALTIFFVWHGHSEKKRLADRLTHVEDLQRNQLVGLVEKVERALVANTESAKRHAAMLERIVQEGCGERARVEHGARRAA